jgi:hypothetical protein
MLLGRFRNEYGAHAGHSQRELHDILRLHFSTAKDVSVKYTRLLYPKYTRAISGIVSTGLNDIVFPSVYFIGSR